MTPVSAILLLVICRHYGWQLTPADNAADVWNIGASLSILGLSAHAWWQERGIASGLCLSVLAAHEVAVICASLAWMVSPWEVPPGAAMLSSWVGFDLAKVGAFVVMLCVVFVTAPVKHYR